MGIYRVRIYRYTHICAGCVGIRPRAKFEDFQSLGGNFIRSNPTNIMSRDESPGLYGSYRTDTIYRRVQITGKR